MPQLVPIRSIPNQKLTISLGGVTFDITLRTVDDFTATDVEINNVLVLQGSRTPAGCPLLPYRYEEVAGNFMFSGGTLQLPYYTKFNVTQLLFYYTPAEIAAIRALPPPVFDPIAALPLRYKPEGYTSP